MNAKFLGSIYRGFDPVTGKEITCTNGAEREMSDQKFAQLQKDYPGQWEAAGAEKKPEVKEDAKAEASVSKVKEPEAPAKAPPAAHKAPATPAKSSPRNSSKKTGRK